MIDRGTLSYYFKKERKHLVAMERRYSFLRTRWRNMLIMIQVLDPFEQFVNDTPSISSPPNPRIGLQ